MPARILSSFAKRTKVTAKICAKWGGYQGHIRFEEDLYETSCDIYINFIRGFIKKYDSVMIVGHNPEISDVITIFTGDQLNMSPCTLACIEFAIENWDTAGNTNGILKWVQIPAHKY
jgi:phosphohistidine phosphatase